MRSDTLPGPAPTPLYAGGTPCPIRAVRTYRDGMSDLSGRDETLSMVELETDEGRECIIYRPAPGYPLVGVTFIPAALLDEES